MGFPRQECWSGLPFPSPGDLPNLRIETRSPDSLPSELQGRKTLGMFAYTEFFFLSFCIYRSYYKNSGIYIYVYVSEFKLIMISLGYILKGNYAKCSNFLKVLNHIDKLFSGKLTLIYVPNCNVRIFLFILSSTEYSLPLSFINLIIIKYCIAVLILFV